MQTYEVEATVVLRFAIESESEGDAYDEAGDAVSYMVDSALHDIVELEVSGGDDD